MTAGLEAAAAEEWLNATLNGDATLLAAVPSGFYDTLPAPNTPYPVGIYQFMSGIDYAAVGAFRIWQSMVYMVKVIGETADFATLNAAIARLDALLHRASGTSASGTVWSCTREQSIRLPDAIEGRQYRHSGALYRIYAT